MYEEYLHMCYFLIDRDYYTYLMFFSFQAFSIHKELEALDLSYEQAKEIVNIELTAYEFAEALSLRPDALFVKQMFALIDADGNGYISFREFLNVIVIFAKGLSSTKFI